MVKYAGVFLLLMAFAAPAFAQDDYPQMEISLGYGNINLKNVVTGRHSGFTSHQSFNLSSRFAIENVLGLYGMGDVTIPNVGTTGVRMISETFGGRVNYRTAGPVVYASAGLGGGWLQFPNLGASSNNAFAFRFGGGVDIPINDYFDVKVDLSRHSYHFSGWNSGFNISTGIVFKISQ
jgi:hypothetical protein